MVWICVRPFFERLEAGLERQAVGFEIEVLNVQNLETGRVQLGNAGNRILIDYDERTASGVEPAIRGWRRARQ